MRSVVVLPAPFGPRNPVIVPRSSAKERPSTATTSPNRFVSESARTTRDASALTGIGGEDPVGDRLVNRAIVLVVSTWFLIAVVLSSGANQTLLATTRVHDRAIGHMAG